MVNFDSDCSWGALFSSPVPGVAQVILVDSSSVPVSAVDRGFEVSSELDAEMSTFTSRISSLHRPESPATAMMRVQQVVVVSPTYYEALGVPLDFSSVANQAGCPGVVHFVCAAITEPGE